MSRSKLPKLQPNQWNNKLLVDKIHQVRSSYCTRGDNYKREIVRENRLDSMFLIRKHKLEEISRQNQLIHQRIWSQKSSYSFSKKKSSQPPKSKRQKDQSIHHLRQIEEIKRQVEKKSELSTAWQTLCKKEHTMPDKPYEKEIGSRLISEVSEQLPYSRNSNDEDKIRQQRTRSCKQIPHANKLNDIILV